MKPEEAIIQFSSEHEIDLVAMSTHGYTGIPRAIFGSVANAVLHGVGKPVLLISPQTQRGSVEGKTNTWHN